MQRCSPTANPAVFSIRTCCRGWRRCRLLSRRPMQGNVSGRHPSPHRGSSVEFAEYRKYVPGDDLRRLDWRAYGRSDRFYIKEFEADTNLRCCLVLDTSGSMDFGSHGHHQDRIRPPNRRGARLSGRAARRRGRAVVRRRGHRAQHSAAAQSGAPDGGLRPAGASPSRKGETQLVPVLHELAETIRQRALIVIISDLFVEPEMLRSCFPALAVPQARRGRVPPARPAGAGLQLPPADAVSRHGRRARRSSPSRTRSPSAITRRSREYLRALQQVVLESAVDYHRVTHRRRLRAGADAVPGRPDAQRRGVR